MQSHGRGRVCHRCGRRVPSPSCWRRLFRRCCVWRYCRQSSLEILFGVVIGPQGMGLVHHNEILDVLSELGLAILFLIAGLEINPVQVRGAPTRLALRGWVLSLAIGLGLGFGGAGTGTVQRRRLHRNRHRDDRDRRADADPQGCRPACAALWPLRPRFGGGGRGAAAGGLVAGAGGCGGVRDAKRRAGLFSRRRGCLRSRLPDASANSRCRRSSARR